MYFSDKVGKDRRFSNPWWTITPAAAVDVIGFFQQIADDNGFSCEREETSITIEVTVVNLPIVISFYWDTASRNYLSTCYIMSEKILPHRRKEVVELIMLVNAMLPAGHFEIYPQEQTVLYRHALVLPVNVVPSIEQCGALFQEALEASQYCPAFSLAIAGKSAREAVDLCMFETIGEA
ncbi:YbjN domain-containing protein [Acetobacteraceae bacterium]|nr:YbjN domain-containing protein [Candidatus Parcubacteria bacterium]